MRRRAIYYQGHPMMLVRGERAVEAVRQGAPLFVFNSQKGWVRGGSGALKRLEQAIDEGWVTACLSYAALVPGPVAIGARGSCPSARKNPRLMEDHRSISQYVHWTLGRYGYVGIGQVTGDAYIIFPVVDSSGRVDFKLNLAANKRDPFGAGGTYIGQSAHHKKLMIKADQREESHVPRPTRTVDWETENPWTPPGALWPRYELKIEPDESYMHQGKRIIHKWRITMMTFDPDSPRPIHSEVGFARNFGDAEHVAFKYADKLHEKEPRNPNDIRVFNDQGRCIWSLQGLC